MPGLGLGLGLGLAPRSRPEPLPPARGPVPEQVLARRPERCLQPGEIPGEFAMNALRLNRGFSMTMFEQRTGLAYAAIADTVDSLVGGGLLLCDREVVTASDLGRRFLDSVIAEFLAD